MGKGQWDMIMNEVDWNPGKLLDMSGYFWKTCTLHAGVKLEIFSIIGSDSLSSEEICKKIKGDMRGVSTLLNALTAMGLLKKEEGRYSNTPAAAKFLSKESPEYVGFMIMHHHHLIDSWSRMDQAVLSGKPLRTRASSSTEQQRESFLMGMYNIAMSIAPSLSKEINLTGCRHLLDFGGGPGTYAIHFCLNNPGLSASVYDLPTTRPFAEKTIGEFGLSDRIDFLEGDYLDDGFNYKGIFDAAWLSYIIHGEGPKDAEKIIGKAVSALKPGGKIFIHEFILNDNMDGPLFPTLFSINMLLQTESGQSYSEKHIFDMMIKHGVKDIKRLDFRGPNESGIIAGVV